MTEKLYYQDPYIKSFTSKVIEQNKDDFGRSYLILEKTAFYPGGGGQPCDLGMIDQVAVTEVVEEDNTIRHYLSHPLDNVQEEVYGMIEWDRRFDHMQQHAGQHILSAAFDNHFELKTVSFHLGQETATIDLDVEFLDDETFHKAEAIANQTIFENHKIKKQWVTQKEAEQYPLRKALSVSGEIRLVIIDSYDYNGCGGTHPNYTTEVGMIKVLGWERHRKSVRLTFVCGGRVIEQFAKKQSILFEATKLLRSSEVEIPSEIERIQKENQAVNDELKVQSEKLLQVEAKQLMEGYSQTAGIHLISHAYINRSIKDLQVISQQIVTNDPASVILLVSKNEEMLQFVCARGKLAQVNMKELTATALTWINGKGGGSPEKAQGGGTHSMSEGTFLAQLLQLVDQTLLKEASHESH